MPVQPEVHGLVALMEIQASRIGARTSPSGAPVLLLEQDRARWDPLLVRRGLAALGRAEALGGSLGPCALQAGREAEAREEFERAAALTQNARERRLLTERAAACAP